MLETKNATEKKTSDSTNIKPETYKTICGIEFANSGFFAKIPVKIDP